MVTRPVRKIIKLFELNDTTSADEMKAVHQAARKILLERGSLEDATATLINDLCTSDDTTEEKCNSKETDMSHKYEASPYYTHNEMVTKEDESQNRNNFIKPGSPAPLSFSLIFSESWWSHSAFSAHCPAHSQAP